MAAQFQGCLYRYAVDLLFPLSSFSRDSPYDSLVSQEYTLSVKNRSTGALSIVFIICYNVAVFKDKSEKWHMFCGHY